MAVEQVVCVTISNLDMKFMNFILFSYSIPHRKLYLRLCCLINVRYRRTEREGGGWGEREALFIDDTIITYIAVL